ncbi:MAG: Asp-tRNA(Asn)/Glu-tRNA(Gln) amidotransferase subunit GatC [Aquiluna sp.]
MSTARSEITPDLVRHLASLSRILVTEDEVEKLAGELGVIVDSVATVNKAVSGDVVPTSHPIPMSNVFREDEVAESLTQEQALSGAADSAEGRFKVAAILDED